MKKHPYSAPDSADMEFLPLSLIAQSISEQGSINDFEPGGEIPWA